MNRRQHAPRRLQVPRDLTTAPTLRGTGRFSAVELMVGSGGYSLRNLRTKLGTVSSVFGFFNSADGGIRIRRGSNLNLGAANETLGRSVSVLET